MRPGSDDQTISKILRTGTIRLDYEVPGLRPDMNRDELIATIRTYNPDRSDKGVRARAGQLVALFGKVEKGDLVIVPRDKGKSMMIGTISSDSPVVSGTTVEVQVNWIDRNLPLSRFDKDLRYSFMAIHRFCSVSRNNAAERLAHIAKGERDPGFSG